MSKFKILGQFDGDQIPYVVLPDYKERVRLAVRPGMRYSVVLFAHDRVHSAVVTSAVVRRAIARVPVEESLLAIGADFTREATDLLHARDAVIARIGEFGWTETPLAPTRATSAAVPGLPFFFGATPAGSSCGHTVSLAPAHMATDERCAGDHRTSARQSPVPGPGPANE